MAKAIKPDKVKHDEGESAVLWYCRDCGTNNLTPCSWIKADGKIECIGCGNILNINLYPETK